MQKQEEKLEELDSSLSTRYRLSACAHFATNSCLAWRRPTGKPKVALSMNTMLSTWLNRHSRKTQECLLSAKLAWKVSYRRPIKGLGRRRVRHRVSELSIEDIQSLSLSHRGNPPSLVIPPLISFNHPTPSSIHISPWSVKPLVVMRG